MKNSSCEGPDYVWVMLHQARDVIFKVRERELKKYGISSRKAAVLFNIEAIGYKSTPSEIARHLLRESHSVSSILDRMEKQGLVKKVKDLDRKNMVRVYLTDKGQKVYDKAAKRESICEIISCLSDEERRQLISSLKKLRNKALKQLGLEDRAHLLGY